MTSPFSATETTLGTIPDRMRGPVSSITATRELVVPRSMPTMRGFSPKSIWNVDMQFLFDFPNQVVDVSPAIQRGSNLFKDRRPGGIVVFYEQIEKLAIDGGSHP